MPAAKLFKLFRGSACLVEGLPLLLRPRIKRFIVLPLLVSMLVYGLIIWLALILFSSLIDSLMGFSFFFHPLLIA